MSCGKELTLSQTTNFRLPKLKEFADDSFKFHENGRKFSKRVGNTARIGEIACYSVFERFVLQTRKNQGLFGKGLRIGLRMVFTMIGGCASLCMNYNIVFQQNLY